MNTVLEIDSISKKYRIRNGRPSYLSLRERLLDSVKFTQSSSEDFWALRDVSFNVEAGTSVGIVGRNGAGKSTLLKVLSKITPPTQGRIITRGRIASLLEVGTGFHPELTGRENIFFNGSLLGMKKDEITRKFDEIVQFSETEKFLDTPLKHYSSGMQLRLAFSVAAFLEPEILIIDEVLAVGDAEFQRKCMGKMEAVSKSGRTILFVSHNMAALQSICTRGVLLEKGKLVLAGSMPDVIVKYSAPKATEIIQYTDHAIYLTDFSITSLHHKNAATTNQQANFVLMIYSKADVKAAHIGIGINDLNGIRLFTLFSKFTDRKYSLHEGLNEIVCSVPALPLKPGTYFAEIYVGDGFATTYMYYDSSLRFEVLPPENFMYEAVPDQSQGSFMVQQDWK